MTLARYARRRDHLAPHAEMIVGAEREAREVRIWMLGVVVAAEEKRRAARQVGACPARGGER